MDSYDILMDYALELASKAKGNTSPNPMVGCVILDKNCNMIAKGYHEKAGTPHAEANALKIAGDAANGGTLIVTLEPCSHFGKTPPCSQAIIKAKLAKVIVAVQDPNPKVNGKGIKELQDAGIEVIVGVREQEALELNEVFFKWAKTQLPFVSAKLATTLDGKIATSTGDSRWITNEQSRVVAHELRTTYDAILVGTNTIKTDDPLLTCRSVKGTNPIRVIVSASLDFPVNSKVITDVSAPTIIATVEDNPKINDFIHLSHLQILPLRKTENGQVDLHSLLSALAQRNITSILVEGGGSIHASFFKENLVDKVYTFIAPKIIGGDGVSPIAPLGVSLIGNAIELSNVKHEILGSDILISGYVKKGG